MRGSMAHMDPLAGLVRKSWSPILFSLILGISSPTLLTSQALPRSLNNGEFCRMLDEFSEPPAKYPFQLMSNEYGYQRVIPELKRTISEDGVYLGVGPEQNFTYIASVRPRMAFIVDIRRDNLLEHLIYKAIFEMSANRSEFISRLFSRPSSTKSGDSLTARELFNTFDRVAGDPQLLERNLRAIKDHLSNLGCPLTTADIASIDTIFRGFFDVGPDFFVRGRIPSARVSGTPIIPMYADLMSATDGAGKAWGYLETEAGFQVIRQLEMRNMIIPVVGDFAGPKALASIARYLKEHSAALSVFYLSNVEDPLFGPGDAWQRFYASLAEFPLASNSTIIRSEGGTPFRDAQGKPVLSPLPGTNFVTYLAPIRDLISAVRNNEVHTHKDVIQMSHQ
jgi:hypothetical protein